MFEEKVVGWRQSLPATSGSSITSEILLDTLIEALIAEIAPGGHSV